MEMQIKTILRFHLTLVRMAIFNKMTTNDSRKVGKGEHLFTAGESINLYNHLKVYQKLKLLLQYNLAILLLHIPRRLMDSTYALLQRYLHTHVYFCIIHCSKETESAQMSINRNVNNEIWYIDTYTAKCYFAINTNKIIKFSRKWMEMKSIILRKVTHTQQNKSNMYFSMCRSLEKMFKCISGSDCGYWLQN